MRERQVRVAERAGVARVRSVRGCILKATGYGDGLGDFEFV